MMDPDDLLASPRGRNLCAQVAMRLDQRVWHAWFYADIDPVELAEHAKNRDALFAALAAVRPDPDALTEALLLSSLADTAAHAMYWQPLDAADASLAREDGRAALRHIAEAVIASTGAAWWSTPMDRERQVLIGWESGKLPQLNGLHERVQRERDGEVADEVRDRTDPDFAALAGDGYIPIPGASRGGNWWSTPVSAPRTARVLGERPVGLVLVEDGFGEQVAAVWPMRVHPDARILELQTADDVVAFLRRFPFDVRASRGWDWPTVVDEEWPWTMPDWAAAAHEYDGVHLTVAGYLSLVARALPLGDDTATVIAGWEPDVTWWLNDVLEVADEAQWWQLIDDTDAPDRYLWRPGTAPHGPEVQGSADSA